MSDPSLPTPADPQLPNPNPDPNPSPNPEPAPSPTPSDSPTLINEPEPEGDKPPVRTAPEKYEAFTFPDGVKLNDEALGKAQELFKGLNLDQAGAQSLIDFHSAELARVAAATEAASDESFRTTVAEWGTQLKADPEIGGKLAEVKVNLGKAYDAVIEAAGDKGPEVRQLVTDFKKTLDLTGIGNHPHFVKFFNRLALQVVEGGHVSGKDPAFVNKDGKPAGGNPGLAQSMYPSNS